MQYLKRKRRFCLFVVLCVMGLAATAQVRIRGQIKTLQVDEVSLIVWAEGYGLKKDEAIEDAQKEAMSKIIYEGLEGFNGGRMLAENQQNHWLRRFFEGRGAPYINYIMGVQVEDDVVKTPKGEYYCRAVVRINYPSLVRSFKGQRILPQNYKVEL